jgi:diguanylate cyclase (GGDEF)-like protein
MWPIFILVAATTAEVLIFTIVYRVLQRQETASKDLISWVFSSHALVDMILFLVGIHMSGGNTSPLPLFLILYFGLLAVLLPGKTLIGLNLLTIVLYVFQMEAYIRGWIQPFPPIPMFQIPVPASLARTVEIINVVGLIFNVGLTYNRSKMLWRAWADAEQKGFFLDRLNEMVLTSLKTTELNDLYASVASHLCKVMQADSACLVQWHTESKQFQILAQNGNSCPETLICPRRIKGSLMEYARRAGAPLSIEDLTQHPYVKPEAAAKTPTRAMLIMPVYGYPDKDFWGSLVISYDEARPFTWQEIQQAQQSTSLIELLISRTRLYQQTIERAELLRELSEHVTQLTSGTQKTTLLPAIVESARNLLKSQRVALFLYESDVDHLTCAYSAGLSERYVEGLNARFKRIPSGVILTGEPYVLIPDVWKDERTSPLQDLIAMEGFRSYAVFALPSRSGNLGALTVYWDQPHIISPSEIAIARLFAEQAGTVLHNASVYARVTEQSLTDEVTNLPNRRALDQRLIEETKRSFRHGHTFTLMMMDLDGFKAINDTFGHPAGDKVLKKISQLLRESVRTSDFVARYGGDEFSIILPETDLDSAILVAEKLRQTLSASALELPQIVEHPKVTASVGLATFPVDTSIPEELIKVADERLYKAKHTAPGTIIYSDEN